jgi:hypothetical protein
VEKWFPTQLKTLLRFSDPQQSDFSRSPKKLTGGFTLFLTITKEKKNKST